MTVIHCMKETSKGVHVTKCGIVTKNTNEVTIWWSDVTCLDCRPFGWKEMPLWKGGPRGKVMIDRRTGERQQPPPLPRKRPRVTESPR